MSKNIFFRIFEFTQSMFYRPIFAEELPIKDAPHKAMDVTRSLLRETFVRQFKEKLWSNLVGIRVPTDSSIWTQTSVMVISGIALIVLQWSFSSFWNLMIQVLTLKVEVDSSDKAFDWLIQWLADQPSFQTAHTLIVATYKNELGQHVTFTPGSGIHYLHYKGKYIKIERFDSEVPANGNASHAQKLTLTLFGKTKLSRAVVNALVAEARKYTEKKDSTMTIVYMGDQYGNWEKSSVRPIRRLDSVILPKKLLKEILKDSSDFFNNRQWYSDRGIPYRRGYLFYGPPGTGKTSLVTALAGFFKMHIYVVNIASKALTDELLLELMRGLPLRCILLMEDIDSVFDETSTSISSSSSISGSSSSSSSSSSSKASSSDEHSAAYEKNSGVTFSGLLNAIDGVAANEGHLLIMTTNRVEKLNKVLLREGRIDLKIEFKLSTRDQVRRLFRKFYEGNDEVTEDMVREFGEIFPKKKVAMAEVQGLLMQCKGNPRLAIQKAKAKMEEKKDLFNNSNNNNNNNNTNNGVVLQGVQTRELKTDEDDEHDSDVNNVNNNNNNKNTSNYNKKEKEKEDDVENINKVD